MNHILVPTDFSKTANAAISHAVEFAARTGARVTLLHVVHAAELNEKLSGLDAIANLSNSLDISPEKSRYVPAHDLSSARGAAQAKLDELAGAAPETLTIETAVTDGQPAHAIIEFANENGVDLIAMGTHGRGRVGRMLLGSVTEKVIRKTECPIMLVRHKHDQPKMDVQED